MDGSVPAWSIIDWAGLWTFLVERGAWGSHQDSADPWADRAEEFNARQLRRWNGPHLLRDCVLARIESDSSVLDIGAGTGNWAISLADSARSVTALDPSPSMRAVMRSNLERAGVGNVKIVAGRWPEAEVEQHDYSFCSHAMYGATDLPRFLQRMIEVTRRRCFLLVRCCQVDGVLAQASSRVCGHPLDSPNFTIAYNILLQLGLTPDVVVDPEPWEPSTSRDLPSALAAVKAKLGVSDSTEHDPYLLDLLRCRLQPGDGGFVWPADTRSALVHWQL